MTTNQTTTITMAAQITSIRIVRAAAICPLCEIEISFKYENDRLTEEHKCPHYLGRTRLDGNLTGFRFGEPKPAEVRRCDHQ